MDSLIFVLTIVFVGYIVYWSIKNDNVRSISEQQGLLRMQNHEEPDKTSSTEARPEDRK